MYLLPGGHTELEDGFNPYLTARREMSEETGIDVENLLDCSYSDCKEASIDIDTHFIPENKNKGEAEHFHHGFRYCFILKEGVEISSLCLKEVTGYKWFKLSQIATDRK